MQARSLRGGITIVSATVGVLALAACGSDRGGTSTAPTAVGPSSGAIVTARDHDDSHGGEVEGAVTSLVSGTSCPTLSFMIGATKVSVTMATIFEEGTCASIVLGARVEVEGTRQADNSILASKIEVEENEGEEREGEGVITSLKAGTACPTLTFFIGSIQVNVTTATMFEHGTCADLTVGRRVHVKGNTVGGVVTATRIEIQNESPGHPEIEGDARISSLVAGTSCPTLQFKVEQWTVTLQASTEFVNGTCANIAVGKKVGVKGTVTSDHLVLATKIVFKNDDDD